MSSEKITTIAGAVAALSEVAQKFDFYSDLAGLIGVIAIAVLGYYTNKR